MATFNIRYDNPSDPISWEARRNDVANIIGFYDIVGLQEALPHQVEDIAQRLPWMSHFGLGRDANGGGEACPIFYNHAVWELLHHETLWLAPDWKTPGAVGWSADLPRIVTVGWFHHKKSGKRVRVYNTHWSHVSEEARMASAELIASIDAIHGVEATAVLGDFNEEAEGAEDKPWSRPGSSTRTTTHACDAGSRFPPTRPSSRLVQRVDPKLTPFTSKGSMPNGPAWTRSSKTMSSSVTTFLFTRWFLGH